jgi:hypothetical protein
MKRANMIVRLKMSHQNASASKPKMLRIVAAGTSIEMPYCRTVNLGCSRLEAAYLDLLQAQTTKLVDNHGFKGGMEPRGIEEPLNVYWD